MGDEYSVYCDESCHLEKDRSKVMSMGAIRAEGFKVRKHSLEIREIKRKNGLADHFEIKWTKVSPAKLRFYLEVIDYFFSQPDLQFRSIVLTDKSKLDHQAYLQTHDSFYYKFYYQLVKGILSKPGNYRVFLDIKDTQGVEKVDMLREILGSKLPENVGLTSIEQIRSDQVPLVQCVDLLLGAITYHHRGLRSSPAKQAIIRHLQDKTGLKFRGSTKPGREKFDHFIWEPDWDRSNESSSSHRTL